MNMQTPSFRKETELSATPATEALPSHFTVSAIVIELDHILLVHHKRIGAWLPPGGHIEEGELPHQACLREVLEETGLKVEVASEAVPETNCPDAFFPPQPFCLHIVKATEKGSACFHLDLAYICKVAPPPHALPDLSQAGEECRWVKLDRLSELLLAKNVTELVQLARAKSRTGVIS
jgi:8-oxo-dGTP diphosphatase